MTDRPRVAFFVPNLRVGGAQRVTVTIANALADRGYRIDVVVVRGDGELATDVEDAVGYLELDAEVAPGLGIATCIPELARYLSRNRPRVLFSQMTHGSLVALLAAIFARSGTALFGVEHSEYASADTPRDQLVAATMRHGYRWMDGVVAVSTGVAESVRDATRVAPSDVEVVYNPIDVDEVREAGAGEPPHRWLAADALDVVLGVGRFDPRKDYETMIEAFDHLHRHRPSTRLVLLGDGPTRSEIQSQVRERALTDVVAFQGSVSNPYVYMTNASVMMLSSRSEGLPTVLVEALACGCPVVSTDCSTGPREILDDGAFGELVSVGDAVALARATAQTLDANVDASRLVSRAQRYAPGRVVTDYEALIRSVR